MSVLRSRMAASRSWWENYVFERETRRTRMMYRDILFMLGVTILTTWFLASFR